MGPFGLFGRNQELSIGVVHIEGIFVLDVGSKIDILGDSQANKYQRVLFHSPT